MYSLSALGAMKSTEPMVMSRDVSKAFLSTEAADLAAAQQQVVRHERGGPLHRATPRRAVPPSLRKLAQHMGAHAQA